MYEKYIKYRFSVIMRFNSDEQRTYKNDNVVYEQDKKKKRLKLPLTARKQRRTPKCSCFLKET